MLLRTTLYKVKLIGKYSKQTKQNEKKPPTQNRHTCTLDSHQADQIVVQGKKAICTVLIGDKPLRAYSPAQD